VPVPDPKAVEELRYWFREYDTIPWEKNLYRLNTVAKDVIGREVSATDLKYVFPRRAAKMGFTGDEIRSIMGVKAGARSDEGNTINQMVRKHNPSKANQLTYRQYLACLDCYGPITATEIMEITDKTKAPVNTMLRKMNEEGYVEKVGKQKAESYEGNYPFLWDNRVAEDTLLECKKESCSDKFGSFRGRSLHTSTQH